MLRSIRKVSDVIIYTARDIKGNSEKKIVLPPFYLTAQQYEIRCVA